MRTAIGAVVGVVVMAGTASAHFVFAIPAPTNGHLTVVFSEYLEPDDAVALGPVAKMAMTVRDACGEESPLKFQAGEHSMRADVAVKGPWVAFGSVEYGVLSRGNGPAFLLKYHAKAVGGSIVPKTVTLGEAAVLEIVPHATPAGVRLQVLSRGKPVADAEVNVLTDAGKEKPKTDAEGYIPAITAKGQIGGWTKLTVAEGGESGGKKYAEVRHYASIVLPASQVADLAQVSPPPLPAGVTSFGADALNGAVYVYGGHAGKTHTYSRESSLGRFLRWNPADGNGWEELPGGPALQGLMLVPYKDTLIRIGGMASRNAAGEPGDSISVPTVARFDFSAKAWKPMPDLPAGRSSFGAAVIGDTLYVAGGWNMQGRGQPSLWPDTALSLDLSAAEPEWKSMPQPFKRRALSAAEYQGKLYVVGGLNDEADTTRTVNIFDPKTNAWTTGPELPEGRANGFSAAAINANGRLYVSPSDGTVYRLSDDGQKWDAVAKLAKPRMVHRIVPLGNDLIVIGGAAGGGNAAEVERIAVK